MSVKTLKRTITAVAILAASVMSSSAWSNDLKEIRERGVLRHIGVPYANFVSYIEQGEMHTLTGLDVDIVKGFASSLGVRYEYVPAQWSDMVGKLTGQDVQYRHNRAVVGGSVPIEGDLIANGVTILDWREEVLDFSQDYFPSAVWLVSRTDSSLSPIKPSGSIDEDVKTVKELIDGREVLALEHSCLDPNLYDLYDTGAKVILPDGKRLLNEMVPAIMKNDAESTLLDVADTLIALEKWPGEIKVIGPVSENQKMAVAFRKNSPELREAFDRYLDSIKNDGTYEKLVKKYYPSIYYFYNDYFLEDSKKIR
ncbi:TPA: transporter substrate-binding domain-containing protein [Vibrio parahaemolyticus]|uniref:transporter substrate-binding domain-containing protein n=3 Tax=Vibrio parahaemolyticus TaxID=670 RepID=UPI0015DE65E3|nr:transporter substrate-binding domain-containing protein [Vibrio parahaemolyticus]EHH1223697.1 transporter substrate-binding domain-containing protein [Vibrio parahaemolyticus]EIY8171544.1 transporter substrate-binding domain-containing protein [Vibrio parahaemolyticus]EIY8250044.1 transporter substrate-binding domain-containing protein [Vibrio parahaemolyticus]ELA8140768.1 transporter substrate-binding domain-containing protein [Vibrio parahaemolyticus]MBM4893212.1 transporter substrate-bin